jgi:hypothetical protein
MLWLMMVVLTPFATRVLVGDTFFPMAFTLYAGIQSVAQLTFLGIILLVRHDHLLRAEVPAGTFTPAIARTIAFAVSFLISIPIAYRTHWAFAFWAITPFAIRMVRLLMVRRRADKPDPIADRRGPSRDEAAG